MTEKESVFKQVCIKLYNDFANEYIDIDKYEEIVYSKKHKRKMNRINRETIGRTKAIYPEVDNAFERLRSEILRKIKKYRHK